LCLWAAPHQPARMPGGETANTTVYPAAKLGCSVSWVY
jgi:hypothetical protein